MAQQQGKKKRYNNLLNRNLRKMKKLDEKNTIVPKARFKRMTKNSFAEIEWGAVARAPREFRLPDDALLALQTAVEERVMSTLAAAYKITLNSNTLTLNPMHLVIQASVGYNRNLQPNWMRPMDKLPMKQYKTVWKKIKR